MRPLIANTRPQVDLGERELSNLDQKSRSAQAQNSSDPDVVPDRVWTPCLQYASTW